MANLNMGQQPGINWPALDAELHAALPGKLDGTSFDKRGELVVHVKDSESADALRPQIAAVLAAHDPAVKTPEQREDEARETTRRALEQADFARWKADVQNAASLAALRPLLLQLGRVVWMLAKAQGLTRAQDPEA
jgi:hypothetical protein